jgi:hypothetical protein
MNRYWGIFKQEWYSICSAHKEVQHYCQACFIGSWHNIILLKVGHYFYENHYKLWYWWNNLEFKKAKLKKIFPNL